MCQSKEYQKACQERERAKAKQLEEVQAKKLEEVQIESVESEEVSIVKQSDVINPNEVDGKRAQSLVLKSEMCWRSSTFQMIPRRAVAG